MGEALITRKGGGGGGLSDGTLVTEDYTPDSHSKQTLEIDTSKNYLVGGHGLDQQSEAFCYLIAVETGVPTFYVGGRNLTASVSGSTLTLGISTDVTIQSFYAVQFD